MSNKNFAIVIIILSIATIIVFTDVFYKSEPTYLVRAFDFPEIIGEWESDKNLSSMQSSGLKINLNSLTRIYNNKEGETIKLFIVFSQNIRRAIHPPEIGFMGEGETITNKSDTRVTNSIIATKLIVEKLKSKDLVVYWYKVGEIYTRSYLKQQIVLILDRILLKKPTLALITISTKITESNQRYALMKVRRFCNLIGPLLERYIP